MKKILLFLPVIYFFGFINAQNNNGTIDQLEELVQKQTIPITMPDGAKLYTDIFLPITGDSLVLNLPVPTLGNINLEIIPKGLQYIYYPTRNGAPNPNPFQLPLIFTRTTYDRTGGMEFLGAVGSLLGYAYAIQDCRGVYGSEGAYIPLYSDSWDKTPYYDYQPTIDIFPANSPLSSNRHTDGIHMLNYLLDSLKRGFDLNNNGSINLIDKICNGSVGSLGASALAMPAYQLAAAQKTNPNGPGLKGLLNLIASTEHYGHTLYNNGVFRQSLVEDWVGSQMSRFRDINLPIDSTVFNTIHSANDYPQDSINDVIQATYDLLTSTQYDGLATYYPNSFFRYATDASKAMVDANGNGQLNGMFSRYTNYDVPTYHFTGWWDIFITGQLETWRNIREYSPNSNNFQPLVIGPWAHTTISTQSTGDVTYPSNVGDVAGFTVDINNTGLNDILNTISNISIENLLNTELLAFLRQSLNYNSYANIGEPQVRLPRSNRYQPVPIANTLVRFPGEDYALTHADLINFLGGQGGLPAVNIKIYNVISFTVFGFTFTDTIQTASFDIDIPALPVSPLDLVGGLSQPLTAFPAIHNFQSKPPVRAYVVGPQDDGVQYNSAAGNYWLETDSFPFYNNITWNKMFLRENNHLDVFAPIGEEDPLAYMHDPNNPVRTIGGPNMTVKTPANEDSHGQLDYKKPENLPYTTNHPGIVEFESDLLEDTVSIVGYPKMKLFATSIPVGGQPGEPTNTDFMVRVLDVYPDGRELNVFEGTVNARAREYARTIAMGEEDVNAPFSNIAAGRVYEYDFEMYPIGYTFGKDHRIKVLVSSANYPHYMSNPNIPLMEGEFLRWTPGEDANYNFNGQIMQAREAENTVYFQTQFPSYVEMPVFGKTLYLCTAPDSVWVDSVSNFEASVSWAQVPGAVDYTLIYSSNGNDWDTVTVRGVNTQLSGLEPNTTYQFEVASDCNPDEWSESGTFTTPEFCDVPAQLWLAEITDSSAVAVWNAVPYATFYDVYLIFEDEVIESYNTTDTFFLFYPLLADTSYGFYIEPSCQSATLLSDTIYFNTLEAEDTTINSTIHLLSGQSFVVYPNPFTGHIYLSIDGSMSQLICAIYSIDGKLVLQNQYGQSAGVVMIDLESLASGSYLLKVSGKETEGKTFKIFKR